MSHLFGGGGSTQTIMVPTAAPSASAELTPTITPSAPSISPGTKGQTPSFLGSATLPPPGAAANEKKLMGS